MNKSEFSQQLTQYARISSEAQAELAKLCGSGSQATGFKSGLATNVQDILVLLSAFPDCVGYSQNRRGRPILDLTNEAGVQDIVYFMLRPAIADLVPEQPVSDTVRQYSIEDYLSRNLGTVVEAKLVRTKAHGKGIRTELNDDVGKYKSDANCRHLIFFIYDPNKYIESPIGLKKAIEGIHVHNGKTLNVYCIIQT
jgi:hypothetical protein